jgi:hypothetical protein
LYVEAAESADCELGIGFKGGEEWLIHHNEFHGFRNCDGTTGGSGADGQCIVIGDGGERNEIYHNVFYDFSGAAIRFSQADVIFHHNLIRDLVDEPAIGEQSILYVTGGGDGIKIHNNTIIGSYEGVGNSYRSLAGSHVDLQNNIFYDCHNINDAGTTTYDYNCWYSCTQTLSGSNDITDDPLFTDAGSDDYTLTDSSPCIDIGIDLGYTYYGSAPDLGAFEVQPSVPPQPGPAFLAGIAGLAYKVLIKNVAGTLQAEVTDFLHLNYTKAVNAPGLASITLVGDHAAVGLLGNNYQIEVWRRNPRHGIDWYCDFYGLFRGQERYYLDQPYFVLHAPGQMSMLSWRVVAWTASTTDRSTFSAEAAETIMKTLVDYNACANATTGNGRERTGTITGLTIQTDAGLGNSIGVWNCAWKNLLQTLQDLARIAGGDFDLIKTGAQAWEFRWYTGQRGAVRTADLTFALAHGNMASPHYRYNRINEKTAAIAAGQGQGAARLIEIRTGDDYSVTNDVEVYYNASSYTTAAGLQAAGDRRLDELKGRQEFSFDVIQSPSSLYGAHYCSNGTMGDLVTASYDDISVTQKIVGVTVTYRRDGHESIDMQTETV